MIKYLPMVMIALSILTSEFCFSQEMANAPQEHKPPSSNAKCILEAEKFIAGAKFNECLAKSLAMKSQCDAGRCTQASNACDQACTEAQNEFNSITEHTCDKYWQAQRKLTETTDRCFREVPSYQYRECTTNADGTVDLNSCGPNRRVNK